MKTMFWLKVYTTALVALTVVGILGFALLYIELRTMRLEFRRKLDQLVSR